MSMTVTLKPEQEAWLRCHVEAGDFASIEDAALHLIDERIADRENEKSGDLAWAKPDVEEGLAALARGDVISHDEHRSRNVIRLAALRGSGAGHFHRSR